MATDEAPELPALFSGEPQHETFPILHQILPSTRMAASPTPCPFPVGEPVDLPATHGFPGGGSTEDFLVDSDTVALLVLKDGELRYENYWLTGGRDVHWISWSVAKSFISALVGIAVVHGHIESITDPISAYVPALIGSAYDGVPIEDVLQMSSGARWNEDYTDPNSDVFRLVATMTGESTLDDFVAGMEPEHPAGTLCRYNSADTQALGMLLVGATGQPIADSMYDNLIVPLGMEHESYWLTDHVAMPMAYGGLMMTPHDFAKIGELYRRKGDWFGEQVVPASWVEASTRADKPHTQPGATVIAGHTLPTGYGYQWWLNPGERGSFDAIGVYNQYVHVDPPSGVVIVKLSANRRYGTTGDEASDRDMETEALFAALIDAVS